MGESVCGRAALSTAVGAVLDMEDLREECVPFIAGTPDEDALFVTIDAAGWGGLSEPSGPSLSACAVSAVVSTIAIEESRGIVDVLVCKEFKTGMRGIGVVVGDDAGVLGCSRGAERDETSL